MEKAKSGADHRHSSLSLHHHRANTGITVCGVSSDDRLSALISSCFSSKYRNKGGKIKLFFAILLVLMYPVFIYCTRSEVND